jgi:protein-S-isoprenylcysteine O-methyltransferase Ste14
LAIAIALQILVPLSIPFGKLTPVAAVTGAILTIDGLAVVVLARGLLSRFGQPTDPGRPTSRLVTTGVFAISRNPLYLGGVMVLAGVGLAFNLVWILLLLTPGLLACNYVLIIPEERYLVEKFGDEYKEYAKTVGRWVGRAAR